MVKLSRGRRLSGPSSSIGLMRFFDAESKAPKLSPEFVFAAAVAVTVGIIILQAFVFR